MDLSSCLNCLVIGIVLSPFSGRFGYTSSPGRLPATCIPEVRFHLTFAFACWSLRMAQIDWKDALRAGRMRGSGVRRGLRIVKVASVTASPRMAIPKKMNRPLFNQFGQSARSFNCQTSGKMKAPDNGRRITAAKKRA